MTRSLTFLMLGLLASTASAQTVLDPKQVALVCAYNSSPSAPVSGQYYFVQCDQYGKLITSGGGGGGGSPGGTNGQVQYNAFGSFGGFTVGGDGTLNTTTGALTVTKTNGTSFSTLATTTPGTGVATALGVNTGSAGAFVVNGGALGTPSSGTLTNATGLPVSGISATGTPSSTTSLFGDGTWKTAATGSVTSVAQTFTGGLISVSGSPITSSGTLALTVAGTSGGIPYFSSASTWATSAALAASALVIGGGAGAAPATTTTGTGVLTALGNATNAASGLVALDASANLQLGSTNVYKISTDNGISRLGAASLAIGNGTAGNFSGALKLNSLTAGTGSKTAPAIVMGSTAGMYVRAGTLINYSDSVTEYFSFATGGGLLRYNLVWAWSSSTPDVASGDVGFSRVSAGLLALGNGTASDISGGLQLTRILGSSGALSLGAADAAAPVAQTLQVQNVSTGTSNTNGANFTIAGSKGTGTGTGGSLIFQVSPAGTTGTSQNALATALTIDSTKTATFTGAVKTLSTTVSALPSASTAGAGARAFVTDATATTFLSTVAGGGSNKVPVVSDGTNWLIGG